jgi:hypothetical protein
MNLGDLLTPWFVLALVILPLVWIERWIHSHLYGVGWLLTNNDKSATALYYVLLSPGVFVHEFVQYIVAGALNVKIKRVIAWPEAQKDGTLRLDFVRIQKANRAQIAVLGAVPLIAGLALVWLISSQLLNLDQVVEAIPSGDLNRIGSALQEAASAPDFLLWVYFIFAISNAMFPTTTERQAWPLIFGLFAVVIVFLIIIGVGDVLAETFTGPVAHGVERITIAFGTVLVAEIPGILLIGFLEEVLEKTTGRKFQYGRARPGRSARSTREPGSSLPLPPGAAFPSIYNLNLPIPTPAEVKAAPPRARRPAAISERAPGLAERPAFGSADTDSAISPEREARPAERAGTPLGSVPRPSASPTSPPAGAFARRNAPADEDDENVPAARPETPFARRGPLADKETSAEREERPGFRRPESAPGQPESPLLRRSTSADDEPPADRYARAQPASPFRSSPLRDDDDEAEPSFGGPRRPSSFGERSSGDRALGDRPFASRPSPFADDDEDEGADDEDVTYEDFDDADSASDEDEYGDLGGDVDDE